ncbi:MAG: glutathione peroxidase [Ferruginibacter sp.]|nr:glutathione peroxidase [Ferruginibacter sp.]
MTVKQKILKAFYPLVMLTGKSSSGILSNSNATDPKVPIYDYSIPLIQGDTFHLATAKGKKILIVNTASNCGYTNQYEELQKLYDLHKDKLLIIAFPSNDFKNQEKGSNEEVAQFCKSNYGISFPIARKGVVSKNKDQQELYRWLTDKNLNGWNEKAPEWNFSKYLINENGVLVKYFPSAVSPMEILNP